jgi:hypothetical protein
MSAPILAQPVLLEVLAATGVAGDSSIVRKVPLRPVKVIARVGRSPVRFGGR